MKEEEGGALHHMQYEAMASEKEDWPSSSMGHFAATPFNSCSTNDQFYREGGLNVWTTGTLPCGVCTLAKCFLNCLLCSIQHHVGM